ncbi:MAG: hypothetical protein ACI9Y1_003648 [Lentisphaeria bacterium]|jgi:hypothetical protein
MNTFQSLELDPSLKNALTKLTEACKSAMDEAQTASQAESPMAGFMQINNNMSEMFKSQDWTALYSNMFQPDAYIKSIASLTELQKSTIAKFTDGQKQFFDTITKEAQGFAPGDVDVEKPQKAIASYIDKSLQTYDDLKKELADQSQAMSAVNSAYVAWMQQTLEIFTSSKDTAADK